MAGGSVDELRYTRNPHLQPDHARYFQVGRRAKQEISEMDLIFREVCLKKGFSRERKLPLGSFLRNGLPLGFR